MSLIVEKAYAKVNIGLKVLDSRPDGYHNLSTFFHRIDLFDTISFEFLPALHYSSSLEGASSYLKEGEEDLMQKALRLFAEASGRNFSCHISIEKRIPFKAGLGGGSSDAASALKAANRYFGSPLSPEELMAVSLEIGSDVPFFTSGYSAARAESRGEVLTPVAPLDNELYLFFPSFFVETRGAFRCLDSMKREISKLPEHLDVFGHPELYTNDFELVTPRSKELDEFAQNFRYFSLSGSGSTYFALENSTKHAFNIEKCTFFGDNRVTSLKSRFL